MNFAATLAKQYDTRKAKFYVILLKFGRVKFCLGKLTRVFQFCLGNSNSVPVLPRLPTLMSNPALGTRMQCSTQSAFMRLPIMVIHVLQE